MRRTFSKSSKQKITAMGLAVMMTAQSPAMAAEIETSQTENTVVTQEDSQEEATVAEDVSAANVEIAELVGNENIFTFGEDSQTVIDRYDRGDYNSRSYYEPASPTPSSSVRSWASRSVSLKQPNSICLPRISAWMQFWASWTT